MNERNKWKIYFITYRWPLLEYWIIQPVNSRVSVPIAVQITHNWLFSGVISLNEQFDHKYTD